MIGHSNKSTETRVGGGGKYLILPSSVPTTLLYQRAAKCYNFDNFYPNSNFDISGNCAERSSVLYMI